MQNNGNMIRFATAFLASVSLTGCESTSETPLVLESDLWVTTCGITDTTKMPGDDGTPSVEFLSDGQIQGFTCCNSFFGSYSTRDSSGVNLIDISVEGMTLSLCPHSDQEQVFIEKLRNAQTYAVTDNHLNLKDNTGEVTLTFITASTIQKKP